VHLEKIANKLWDYVHVGPQ